MFIEQPVKQSEFYVVGGTLRRDASCYVKRQADDDLYECLRQNHFCYVLTPRQMGKSSLMIRTASRLAKEGCGVVILDLTATGQHLSIDQWYGGLLAQIGSQTGLEDSLLDFWENRKQLGPLQRWVTALCEIVLPAYPNHLTIFVDEIDAVRSLPFSTDEFFTGIRELYNRRTIEPQLEKLTFCLLGVATPADLISDARTTPFNIGRRIELLDFSETEAASLAKGLNRNETQNTRLLKRIYHWTSGHPYLTQRFCQTIANSRQVQNDNDVDKVCFEMFLSASARERDDNLLFVRDRLLKSTSDLPSLLGLYRRVCAGEKIFDDKTDVLKNQLMLSGVTKSERGLLMLRNRIYARVFDKTWISENLPDAELRRQRSAYWRGVLRATTVSVILVSIFAALLLTALRQHDAAADRESARRKLLYAAHMNIAAQDWDKANIDRIRELLESHLPNAGDEDLRGFEWFYFWRLLHSERMTLPSQYMVITAAFSPDGKTLATAGKGNAVEMWNVANGTSAGQLSGHRDQIWKAVFSPDGRRLATASWDHTVKIWNLSNMKEALTIQAHDDKVCGLSFSPDGQTIATSGWDKQVRLWNAQSGQLIRTFSGHESWVWSVEFSQDGSRLATAGEDQTVIIWDSRSGSKLFKFGQLGSSVYALAFSRDGSRLASGFNNGSVKIWDTRTGKELLSLYDHSFSVNSVSFSADGKRLATAGFDRIIRFWDLATGQKYWQLKGHSDEIRALAVSFDGSLLASVSDDKTVKVWDFPQPEVQEVINHPDEQTQSVCFSSDGRCLATSSQQKIYIRDTATGTLLLTIPTQATINDVVFSPDCRFIAAAHRDNSISLWDVSSGQFIALFKGHKDQVFSLAFTPDARILASCSRDHSLKLWDVMGHSEVFSSDLHSAGVKAIAISNDGNFLATGSDDHTLLVWDLQARRAIKTLKGHINEVWSVAFSPDGLTLASGSYDRSIKIWDWRNEKVLMTLRGHSAGVRAVTYSPDGKRLVSGGEGGTIKLWDTATGNELTTLYGHRDKITALAFSQDGQTLASTSQDRTARLWRAMKKDEVTRIISQSHRPY